MATIARRKRADGSMGYTATVRIKKGGKVVFSQSETFFKLGLAKGEWASATECALKRPGALERAQHRGVMIGDLLTRSAMALSSQSCRNG